MNDQDLTRIDFAVYLDVPVPGWPADLRKLVRAGSCPLGDLDLQEMAPAERSFAIADNGDPMQHAVSIEPYPHLVEIPT